MQMTVSRRCRCDQALLLKTCRRPCRCHDAVQAHELLEFYEVHGADALEARDAPQLTWDQVRVKGKVWRLTSAQKSDIPTRCTRCMPDLQTQCFHR